MVPLADRRPSQTPSGCRRPSTRRAFYVPPHRLRVAHLVFFQKEERQINKMPDQPKQPGFTPGANPTSQTKRCYMSTMPTDIEQPQKKDSVMSHLWPFARVRQPGRTLFLPSLHERLCRKTIFRCAEKLMVSHTVSLWSRCLECEFQLRSTALKLCREANFSIQKTFWAASSNPRTQDETSTTSPCSAVTSTTCRKQSGSSTTPSERCPRHTYQGYKSDGMQQLSLIDSPACAKADKVKGPRDTKFDVINFSEGNARVHPRNSTPPGFCNDFQRKVINGKTCACFHACVGCNKPNAPCADCLICHA